MSVASDPLAFAWARQNVSWLPRCRKAARFPHSSQSLAWTIQRQYADRSGSSEPPGCAFSFSLGCFGLHISVAGGSLSRGVGPKATQPMHELIESRLARKLEATLGRWEASVRIRSARKRALVDGIFRTFVALGILVGDGSSRSATSITTQSCGTEPDLRVGPGLLFALLAGGIYGVMALRTLYRVCDSSAEGVSK